MIYLFCFCGNSNYDLILEFKKSTNTFFLVYLISDGKTQFWIQILILGIILVVIVKKKHHLKKITFSVQKNAPLVKPKNLSLIFWSCGKRKIESDCELYFSGSIPPGRTIKQLKEITWLVCGTLGKHFSPIFFDRMLESILSLCNFCGCPA